MSFSTIKGTQDNEKLTSFAVLLCVGNGLMTAEPILPMRFRNCRRVNSWLWRNGWGAASSKRDEKPENEGHP